MSLLDDIAQIIGDAIPAAGLTRDAVLTKLTDGATAPGETSGSGNPTPTAYTAQGIVVSLNTLQLDGTLIEGVDIAVRLIGNTISGGAVPEPNDRITIEDETYVIVPKGVDRGATRATYVCQCRR